ARRGSRMCLVERLAEPCRTELDLLLSLVGGRGSAGEPLERVAELLLEQLPLSDGRLPLAPMAVLLVCEQAAALLGRGLRLGRNALELLDLRERAVTLREQRDLGLAHPLCLLQHLLRFRELRR